MNPNKRNFNDFVKSLNPKDISLTKPSQSNETKESNQPLFNPSNLIPESVQLPKTMQIKKIKNVSSTEQVQSEESQLQGELYSNLMNSINEKNMIQSLKKSGKDLTSKILDFTSVMWKNKKPIGRKDLGFTLVSLRDLTSEESKKLSSSAFAYNFNAFLEQSKAIFLTVQDEKVMENEAGILKHSTSFLLKVIFNMVNNQKHKQLFNLLLKSKLIVNLIDFTEVYWTIKKLETKHALYPILEIILQILIVLTENVKQNFFQLLLKQTNLIRMILELLFCFKGNLAENFIDKYHKKMHIFAQGANQMIEDFESKNMIMESYGTSLGMGSIQNLFFNVQVENHKHVNVEKNTQIFIPNFDQQNYKFLSIEEKKQGFREMNKTCLNKILDILSILSEDAEFIRLIVNSKNLDSPNWFVSTLNSIERLINYFPNTLIESTGERINCLSILVNIIKSENFSTKYINEKNISKHSMFAELIKGDQQDTKKGMFDILESFIESDAMQILSSIEQEISITNNQINEPASANFSKNVMILERKVQILKTKESCFMLLSKLYESENFENPNSLDIESQPRTQKQREFVLRILESSNLQEMEIKSIIDLSPKEYFLTQEKNNLQNASVQKIPITNEQIFDLISSQFKKYCRVVFCGVTCVSNLLSSQMIKDSAFPLLLESLYQQMKNHVLLINFLKEKNVANFFIEEALSGLLVTLDCLLQTIAFSNLLFVDNITTLEITNTLTILINLQVDAPELELSKLFISLNELIGNKMQFLLSNLPEKTKEFEEMLQFLSFVLERECALILRVSICNQLFDAFGNEDLDEFFAKFNFLGILEDFSEVLEGAMSIEGDEGVAFDDETREFFGDTLANLNAFVEYKKQHM